MLAACAALLTACHGAFRQLPSLGGTEAIGKSRVEPRLSRAATRLADEDVEVRCWSAKDWNELVEDVSAESEPETVGQAEGGVIDLAPDACNPLVAFVYDGGSIPTGGKRRELADAVGIFSHELEHVRGTVDEEEAECHGVQRIPETARALGFASADARALAELYWTELYPENDDEYKSKECRSGGELDLRPGDPRWP